MTSQTSNETVLIDRILDQAGQDELQVQLSSTGHRSLRFSNNVITQNQIDHENALSITLWRGQKNISAKTTDISEAGAQALLDQLRDVVDSLPDDPESLGPLNDTPYIPGPESQLPDTKELTQRVVESLSFAQSAGQNMAGSVNSRVTRSVWGNTAGMKTTSYRSRHETTATSLKDDVSGWSEHFASDAQNLDIEGNARQAVERCQQMVKPREIDPGLYRVILLPPAVSELLSFMIGKMERRAADEGRSFLKGKIGQNLIDPRLSLHSDPQHPLAMVPGIAPDGLALRAHTWIDKGQVVTLPTSRYWAKEKQLEATGDISNVLLSSSESQDNLLEGVDRAILVTRFWYIRDVDPTQVLVTGMTRDGLFLVEDGQVVSGLRHFRFNESVLKALNHVNHIGAQTPAGMFRLMAVPSLDVSDFHFTSKTKF